MWLVYKQILYHSWMLRILHIPCRISGLSCTKRDHYGFFVLNKCYRCEAGAGIGSAMRGERLAGGGFLAM